MAVGPALKSPCDSSEVSSADDLPISTSPTAIGRRGSSDHHLFSFSAEQWTICDLCSTKAE